MAQRALLSEDDRLCFNKGGIIVRSSHRHLLPHKLQHRCRIGMRSLLCYSSIEFQGVAAAAGTIEVHLRHLTGLSRTTFANVDQAVAALALKSCFVTAYAGEILLQVRKVVELQSERRIANLRRSRSQRAKARVALREGLNVGRYRR